MKKRVFSLFLCIALCLSLCPTAAFADGEDGHIHEQEEQAPLVVSATMAPEGTEAPEEPAEEPAEPTPEPAPETPAETAPEAEPAPTAEPTPTPEPTAEPTPTPEPTAEPTGETDESTGETDETEALALTLEGASSGSIKVEYYDLSSSEWKTTYYSSMSSIYTFLVTNGNAPKKTSEWGDDPAVYRAVVTLQQDVTVSSNCKLGCATTYNYAGTWHSSSFTGDYTYIKLNLNGHKITVSNGATLTLQGDMIVCDSSEAKAGSIAGSVAVAASDTNLQLQNGNLEKITCEYKGAVTVGSGATVNTFVGKGGSVTVNTGATVGTINAQGNSTTVAGGSVTSITGYGNVTVSDGTVTKLNVSVNGSNTSRVEITGGSIGTFSYTGTNSYDVSLRGGTFGTIDQTGQPLSCVSLLSSSSYYGYYAFFDFDKDSDQIVSAAAQKLTNVEVRKHTACDFAALHNGYCTCGRACEHGGWGTDSTKNQCETCGLSYVARVEVPLWEYVAEQYVAEQDDYVKTTKYCYATSLADAMAATSVYSGSERSECQYTITLLQDVTAETSLAMTGRTRCVTLDLDGHSIATLSYDGEKGADNYQSGNSLFTVKNSKTTGAITNLSVKNGEVTIDSTATITTLNVLANTKEFSDPSVNPNDFMFVTVSGNVTNLNANGGALKVSDGTVGTLTVADGASVQLTGGSITKIQQPAGANAKPVSALLEPQHVFKKKNSGTSSLQKGDVIANNTAISSLPTDLSDYEIVSCAHWDQTADSCPYCAQEFNVATVTQEASSQNYGSVKEAFAAAKEKSANGAVTVKLLDNASVSETIVLDSGTITLDLNGKSLSSEYTILALSGTAALTVDATQSGSISVAHGNPSGADYTAPITVSGTSASLTLNAASVTNDTAGDLQLSGGTTTVKGNSNIVIPVVISNGTLNIEGGTLNKKVKTWDGDALKISGQDTLVNMSGGKVNDTLGITGGTMNVSNGTVNQINATGGTTNVSGGTVTTLNAESGSTVNVSGGMVTTLNVSIGSTVQLTGGTYTTITIPEGKTYLDLLPLTGVAYKRNGNIVDASGATLPGEGEISITSHTCDSSGRCECGRGFVAMIGEKGYNTFTEALNDVQNGETITLLANVTAPADGTNSKIDLSGKTVIIDLNDYDITGAGDLTIHGHVTIHARFVNNDHVKTDDGKFVLVAGENDSLTIDDAYVFRVKATAGTVKVTGGKVDILTALSTGTANVTVSGGMIGTLSLNGTGQHSISDGAIDRAEIGSIKNTSTGVSGTTTITGGVFGTLALNGVSSTAVMLQGGQYKTIEDMNYPSNGSFMDRVTPADSQTAGSQMYAYQVYSKSTSGDFLNDSDAVGKKLQVTEDTQYIHVVSHTCAPDASGLCECGRQYVAKIGEKLYFTLEAALTAATAENATIELLANATAPRYGISNNSVIDRSGKSAVTLDLNGKKLTGSYDLYILGNVTVTDGEANNGSVVVGSGRKVYVGDESATGTLTIRGGTFSDVTLKNGALNVSGGKIGTLLCNGDTKASASVTISGTAQIDSAVFDGRNMKEITGGTATTVNVKALGSVRMTGGKVEVMTIEAIPQEGSTAKLENFTISGGEIGTLTLGEDGKQYTSITQGLTGGSYGKIEIKGGGTLPSVRELLKSGYAFKDGSGAFILWGNAQGASIDNVEVAKCVHQAAGSGTSCQYCNRTLEAQLVANGESSFYTSFDAAYEAVPMTGRSVITLLANGGEEGVGLSIVKTFRLLLGNYELKDKLVIAAGGSLEVGNGSGTMAAIEQTGGTLSVETSATIQNLTVSGGETKLQAGTYTSITTSNGITADDLLGNGYAYFQTADGNKTWLTVTNETALQNVSVGMIPLKASELSIGSSPENPTYGDNVTVTVSYTGSDSLAYQWFEVVNGTESEIEGATDASYTATTPNAGSHTYRCKVTKDGYTVTLDKTVTVARADITDFHTPTANTDLTYNGSAQELIQAGSVDGSIGEMQYKLGEDGTYGADIPTAKNAGTYTVYYIVKGDANYNDTQPGSLTVTIDPLNIGGNSARTYYVTADCDKPYYNGQPQTPAITLTLVHRIDTSPTDTTIDEVEELVKDKDFDCTQSVTQYTNAGFYTISFTGKGNYAGTMTVDWGIERLDAPDATGSLTVYNRIAHTYTVDLASLLPALPSGYEYGKLTYELKATDADENPSEITVEGYLGEYSLSQGTLTLPVNAVDSTDTGAIATLRVTVTPENYFPFTLTLNVSCGNRVSPIDVGKPLEGLTKDNVTSNDREALEKLLGDLDGYLAKNPGEGEKKELEELKKEAGELIERLDDAKAAMEDDAIGAADDIDASNAKPGHKGKLRSAKKAIQDALDTYGPNYTEAEKAALNEKLTRINAALAAIEKLEENAKDDQTDKPVKTGDEATPILWIVLIVVAVGCVVVLLAARKKKK